MRITDNGVHSYMHAEIDVIQSLQRSQAVTAGFYS